MNNISEFIIKSSTNIVKEYFLNFDYALKYV